MRTYRQYCPVARASEIVAERWTPLIVRNLLFGATTFSELAHGVPAMSRSMLIKRLGELEHVGVLTTTRKPNGRGSYYNLTDAGRDLAGVIDELAHWGSRWSELTAAHSDPGFALWAWGQFDVDRSALPRERVVVRFTFPEEKAGNRQYWMLVEHREAEVCYSDPGGEPDVNVVARSEPFTRWHQGLLHWSDAVRSGDIEITGPRDLVRAIPRWNCHRSSSHSTS